MKRETFAFWMLVASLVAWLIVIAITPVGGWCKSNPHSEDYRTAFAITSIVVFACIGFVMSNINNNQ